MYSLRISKYVLQLHIKFKIKNPGQLHDDKLKMVVKKQLKKNPHKIIMQQYTEN